MDSRILLNNKDDSIGSVKGNGMSPRKLVGVVFVIWSAFACSPSQTDFDGGHCRTDQDCTDRGLFYSYDTCGSAFAQAGEQSCCVAGSLYCSCLSDDSCIGELLCMLSISAPQPYAEDTFCALEGDVGFLGTPLQQR